MIQVCQDKHSVHPRREERPVGTVPGQSVLLAIGDAPGEAVQLYTFHEVSEEMSNTVSLPSWACCYSETRAPMSAETALLSL